MPARPRLDRVPLGLRAGLVLLAFGAAASLAPMGAAFAEEPSEPSGPAFPQNPPGQAEQPPPPGQPQTIWTRESLLGDAGGVRTFLGRYGVSIGLQDVEEVMGNVTGGVQRGAVYGGLTYMSLGIDTEQAVGWPGGTFNISAFQIGRSLSANNLFNLQTASGISATPSTRIWELWYSPGLLERTRRHQDRAAKRRHGIHHQPRREPVSQRGDGLASAARL